jgi:hypothetical protein
VRVSYTALRSVFKASWPQNLIGLTAVLACLIPVLAPAPASATQGVPYLVNFQGRLSDNNGNILADGYYDMRFRITDDATLSGAHILWTETRDVATGPVDNRVHVVNGLFSIQLGAVTALSPSLFNSSASRWLEIELPSTATNTCSTVACESWTEGPFSPRHTIGASPYAFVADTLDGLDSTDFGQIAAANTFTGTNTFSKASGPGIILSGSPASSGSLLQIGSTLNSGNASGTLIGANTSLTGDLLNLQVSNSTKLKVDNSGNLTLASGAAITIGSSAGQGTTCSGGQFLQNQVTVGGIVTGGTCATPAGTGANTTLSNLGTTSINADLLPSADNTRNIGSAALVWSNVYAGLVDAGSTTTTLGVGTVNATAITIGRAAASLAIASSGLNVSSGGAVTGVSSLTLSGGISGGTTYTGSGNINTTGGTIQTGSTDRITNAGALTNITGYSQSSGNFAQTGTGTFSTGTGSVSLNGPVAASSTALFKDATNSATAFQVENSNSASVLTLDTTDPNLIVNSSFEPGTTGWTNSGSGSAIAQNTAASNSFSGTASLQVTSGITANGGAVVNTASAGFTSTLAPGTYSLSFYAKATSLANSFSDLAVTITGGAAACTLNAATVNVSGFQRRYCTFTSTGTNITAINIGESGTTSHVFFLDGVQLESASAPSAFAVGGVQFGGSINSPLVVKPSSNDSTALAVQNASGTNILNVDTTDTNLLNTNPGFENGLSGGSGTGWTAVGGSTAISRDTTQAYIGNASMKVAISTATTGGAQYNLNPITTTASTTYTVSFYALLGSTAPTFQVTYSPDNTATNTCSPTGTIVTTGWTRLQCTVTSATTPTTSGYIKIAQTNSASSTWYIDSVQMEAASTASAYGAGALYFNGVITSPTTFQNASNSTTAFAVQNAAGSSLFSIDTVNSRLYVGAIGGDTTGTLFVFGTKTNTGDPTGVAGSEYYNSADNAFRCAQGGTAYVNCISPFNSSTADQSPGAGATTYLTGSNLTIPGGGLHAGTQFIWHLSATKTAAGTAACSFLVKYGTNGSTADTTEITLAGPTNTAAIDTGQFTIILTVRSVNAATGTWTGNLSLTHSLATTGLSNTGSFAATSTSASFNDTVAGSIIGLAFTSGAAEAYTFQQVQVNALGL